MTGRLRMIPLRRYRSESVFSFYDNPTTDNEIESKWTMVRQRLPSILALNPTYKPTNIRTQLILLMALMSKQTNELRRLSNYDFDHNLSHIPSNVMLNIGDRSRMIYLKRIPIEQMIYVDIDGLSFSIPTRQFIIAISRGNARVTAAKYCPPAISEMLINLSKTKVVDDGRQYNRALFKRRIGKMLFFSLFIFISGMIFALLLSAGNTLLKLNSFNHTRSNISITTFSTRNETDEYWKS